MIIKRTKENLFYCDNNYMCIKKNQNTLKNKKVNTSYSMIRFNNIEKKNELKGN